MMNPALSLLRLLAMRAKQRLIRRTDRMMATQEQFLRALIRHHQNTELGQTFHLDTIKTIDQFRDRIPIWSYSQYEPYMNRIAAGEPNVLNPERVMYINLTSGSTGNKKQVPVTRRFQSSLQRTELAGIGFTVESLKQRGQKLGKLMMANSATLQGVTNGGIEYGPVSAGRLRRGKVLFEQLFSIPYDTLQISDITARHYVCLLFALRNPQLAGMTANFPMLILQICNYLEQYAEELIHDLERGEIASQFKLDPDLRHRLKRRCSPAPARAAQLRALLKSEGQLTPKLAWPDLQLIATARGGTSDFYFEGFSDYFDDTPIFGGVYGTAEGNFGVCPDFNYDGHILAIESGFYEFIPADQWDAEQPKTLLPTEVKTGEYYRILVTSYSGLYRYDIGDVVEVLGFYNQAPLIVFRHRRGGLLSATTEKTTEFHVIQVIQALQREFNITLEDFCITLSSNEFPARYLVNIELAAGECLPDLQAFLSRFEYWMGEINNPYRTVRLGDVPPPSLRVLSPGSFKQVREQQIERGIPDSQLKIPHISEDRQLLTGLEVIYEIEFESALSSSLG
ncbi:MAG TPA: GH3 auxin-responsive promoter family protein [Elainellaceae cyanobacterium]